MSPRRSFSLGSVSTMSLKLIYAEPVEADIHIKKCGNRFSDTSHSHVDNMHEDNQKAMRQTSHTWTQLAMCFSSTILLLLSRFAFGCFI